MDFTSAFQRAIAELDDEESGQRSPYSPAITQTMLDTPAGDYPLPGGGMFRRGTGQTQVTDLGPAVIQQPAPLTIGNQGGNLTGVSGFDPWQRATAELDFEDARERGDDLTPFLQRLQEVGSLNDQPELSSQPFAPPPAVPMTGESEISGLERPADFDMAREDYANQKFDQDFGLALFNSPQREQIKAWKKMTGSLGEVAQIGGVQVTPEDAGAYLRATLPPQILKAAMDKYRAEFADVYRMGQAQAEAQTLLPDPEVSRARGLLNAPIREVNRAVQGIAGLAEGLVKAGVDTVSGDKYGQQPGALSSKLGDIQRNTRALSQETAEKFAPSTASQKGKFYEPLNVIETALGQVPQLAVLMTTGGAGGMGMIFAMEAGAAHDELFELARKKGYSETEANKLALVGAGVVGAVNTALERLGPAGEFVAKNRPVKSALVKALRGAKAEGLTEMAQEATNVLTAYGLKVSQPQVEDITRVLAAGLGGAVVGGGTGLGQGVYDARKGPQNIPQEVTRGAQPQRGQAPADEIEPGIKNTGSAQQVAPTLEELFASPTFETPTEGAAYPDVDRRVAETDRRLAGARKDIEDNPHIDRRKSEAPFPIQPSDYPSGKYEFEDVREATRMTDRDLEGMAKRLERRIATRGADVAGVRAEEVEEVDRIRHTVLESEAARPVTPKPSLAAKMAARPTLKDAAAVGQWYAKTFKDESNAVVIEALASSSPGAYVLVDVPVSAIDPNSLMAGDSNQAKIAQIAKLSAAERGNLPPILAIAGPEGNLMIADGTHRLLGRKSAGDQTIRAYIPESQVAKYAEADQSQGGEAHVQEEGRSEEGVLTPANLSLREPPSPEARPASTPGVFSAQPSQTSQIDTPAGAPQTVQERRGSPIPPGTRPEGQTPASGPDIERVQSQLHVLQGRYRVLQTRYMQGPAAGRAAAGAKLEKLAGTITAKKNELNRLQGINVEQPELPARASREEPQASPPGAAPPQPSTEAGSPGASGEAAQTPARTRPVPRSEIEKQVMDLEPYDPSIDQERETAGQGESYFQFKDQIPAELAQQLEGQPRAVRARFRAFTSDQKGYQYTAGDDGIAEFGVDRLIDMAKRSDRGQKLERSLASARKGAYGPRGKLLAHVLDNSGRRSEQPSQKLTEASAIPPYTEFEINGEKFQIVENEEGIRLLKDGKELPLLPVEDLGKIPVDKGSTKAMPEPDVPGGPISPDQPQYFSADEEKLSRVEPTIFGGASVPQTTGKQTKIAYETESEADGMRRPGPQKTASEERIDRKFAEVQTQEMFEEGVDPSDLEDATSSASMESPAAGERAASGRQTRSTQESSPGPQSEARPVPFDAKPSTAAGVAAAQGVLHPIQMPELVRLARELMGTVPTISKRLKKSMGMFLTKGDDARIHLHPNVAKDPYQLARTLAHEIGHLVDWLPDKTLARGNLLGRILKLRKSLFVSLKGISNKEIKTELEDLSKWWRGTWEDAPKWFQTYRRSARELYADALSVLLNTPGELETRAPKFYAAFLEHLDKNPPMMATYLDIQDLLSGTPEEIMAARRADIREAFSKGEDILRAKEAQRKAVKVNVIDAALQLLVDRAQPMVSRQKKLDRAGVTTPEGQNLRYAMEELALMDNVNHRMLDRIQANVMTPLVEAGMAMDDLGEYLLLTRILNERTEITNPWGHTPKTAGQMRENLRKALGPTKTVKLEAAVAEFHEIVFDSVTRARDEGVYSSDTYKNVLLPNKANYATFAVLDYLEDHIGAGIIQQVGTFKEVANPFLATVMKTITLNRLIELNHAKSVVRDGLTANFPTDIDKQPVRRGPEGRPLPAKRSPEGKAALTVLEDGSPVHYDVDQYIAKAFELHDIGLLNTIGGLMQKLTYKVFHPLFVTYNPAWQIFNYVRDVRRTYVNLSRKSANVSVRQVLRQYWKAIPAAARRARGVTDAQITQMIDERALDVPFVNFDPSEDTLKYDKLLERHGLGAPAKARGRLGGMIANILNGIEVMGVFSESLPKLAAWNYLGEQGITGKERAFVVRNYVGTPNVRTKGLAGNLVNGLWMYSKIFLSGARADAEIAVQPSTRAGHWFKRGMIDLLPKLAMKAMALGLFGEALRRIFELIPDYYKGNYTVIPLGTTRAKDGSEKAAFMALPSDETGRFLGGLLWHLLKPVDRGADGKVKASADWKQVQELLGFAKSQTPSFAPPISVASNWYQYMTGVNPRDDFYRQNIIPDERWKAGGWYGFRDMLGWTANQFGVVSIVGSGAVKKAVGLRPGESEETTTQVVIGAIPGINRLIRFSDRGIEEGRWAEIESEDAERAKFRLSLDDETRSLVKLRYKLNRFGVERLNQTEQIERARVNAWYANSYLNITKAIDSAVATGNKAMETELRKQLADSAKNARQAP